jgi:hypothetical protein
MASTLCYAMQRCAMLYQLGAGLESQRHVPGGIAWHALQLAFPSLQPSGISGNVPFMTPDVDPLNGVLITLWQSAFRKQQCGWSPSIAYSRIVALPCCEVCRGRAMLRYGMPSPWSATLDYTVPTRERSALCYCYGRH